MKKEPNQNRIIILSVAAVFVYIFMVANSFSSGWDAFKMGYRSAYDGWAHTPQIAETPGRVYFLSMKAREGYIHFPDKIYNNRTESFYPARSSCLVVALPKGTKIPTEAKYFDWLMSFLIIFSLFLYIVTPIIFILLIHSLYSGNVFDKNSKSYTRYLGIILLLAYGCIQGVNYASYRMHQSLFSFEEYRHVFSFRENYLLMMGVAVLLTAEILRRGLIIKEEQDLTV